jgi:hypothetical protein
MFPVKTALWMTAPEGIPLIEKVFDAIAVLGPEVIVPPEHVQMDSRSKSATVAVAVAIHSPHRKRSFL